MLKQLIKVFRLIRNFLTGPWELVDANLCRKVVLQEHDWTFLINAFEQGKMFVLPKAL